MTYLRANKVQAVAQFIPDQAVEIGPTEGEVAIVGWGSTYGALYQAVRRLARTNKRISHIHLRHLNPFPNNLGALLRGFERIIVPEMNMGQLATLLRDKLGVEVVQYNKVTGQPFQVRELIKFVQTQTLGITNVEPLPRVIHGERV
jgi:2-oxoglutarate ferredoxin oxidoreductase subunit alpha